MSTTYSTYAGDTFESIARKLYGSEQYSSLIIKANPGALEPLQAGTVLTVPDRPGAPTDKQSRALSANADEVALLINGVRFRFWSELRLSRTVDGMDTLEFSAPFDESARDFRDIFRPFSYAPMVVTVGGDVLFTGTMVDIAPNLSASEKTVSVSGYSVAGVLNDCTPSASAFPLEFNDQTLADIARTLAEPFGIDVIFDADSGSKFERVAVEPGDRVLAFLTDLAQQRNLVISSTPEGSLLFQQSATVGNPVAVLQQGVSPVLAVRSKFSPQQYYSHITGLDSVLIGTDGSQYTAKNPYLLNAVRPLTFKAPDAEGGDVKQAVQAKLGRMFANAAVYTVRVNTWRSRARTLWAPNTTLKLEAPGAMVYSPYEFIIRSVSFERSGAGEAAELELILPGAFSGEVPEALPWE